MKKQVIRLTESDLHNIIKNSVNKILKEGWEDDYNAAMDKQDYMKKKEEYDSKAWYQKILAMISGNKPKDPNASAELKDLLNNYVNAFNKEHGIGKRMNFDNGESFHSTMGYSTDKQNYGQPVLSATYFDGNGATQSRKAYKSNGDEKEWGIRYPYSEIGVTGDEAPINANPTVKKQYQRFHDNRREIQNAIRKRNNK